MDKYQELRIALPQLIDEAKKMGGENSRAKIIIDLLEERDCLLKVAKMALNVLGCVDSYADENSRERADILVTIINTFLKAVEK